MSSNIGQDRKKYFDCNATSPVSPLVLENLNFWAEQWGNPSSIHAAGRGPKTIIREARQHLATALGVSPLELIFTSGGSESNNTVIKSAYHKSRHGHFICTAVEHPSVLKTFQSLAGAGAKVDYIPVSKSGFLDFDFYQDKLNHSTSLVSVMTANNETGNIFPIKKMAKLAQDKSVLFHTDAVQVLGKFSFNLREFGVDFASFSAHKFYALKGVGLLYVRKGAPLENLILGGGQERHRRGGTENILGIAAFGKMAEQLYLTPTKTSVIEQLRDHMELRILNEIDGISRTGDQAERLSNTSSLVIDRIDGETLLMSMDLKGFAVSTGAACSSGNPEPSPVLLAMGLTREEAQSSLRISLSWYHTLEDIDAFVETLKQVVFRLRSLESSKSFDVRESNV